MVIKIILSNPLQNFPHVLASISCHSLNRSLENYISSVFENWSFVGRFIDTKLLI